MLIRENGRDYAVVVYAIYWVKNTSLKSFGRRIHLVIPYDGYSGLITVSEEDCQVIDPSINGFILKKDDYGGDMLVHWAAEKDNLIYDLIEHDPEAMAKFERRLDSGQTEGQGR